MLGHLVTDHRRGTDRSAAIDPEPLAEQMVHVLDHLAGMYFWWDAAPRPKRDVYHGRVAASLDGGYYLLEFAPHDKLPAGVHEVAHVATMADQAWSFYRVEAEYLAALSGGTTDAAR